jgi:hypothetical protein
MNQKNMNELLMAIIAILAILVAACAINNLVSGQSTSVVNVTELDTLDRMRYTAIQMTIMDLQSNQSLNMTDEQIASKIFEYQRANDSIDRLTTLEVENLYRNITQ